MTYNKYKFTKWACKNLRETTKQIKIENFEQDKLKDYNQSISLDINKYENTIILLQSEKSNIFTNINIHSNEIKNLSINFKVNILEKFIELISFGIINYKQKHLKILDEIKKQIQELENNIIQKEDHISKEKIEVTSLQLKQNSLTNKIEQIQIKIIELENQFIKKMRLFKNKLLAFQTKITTLSRDRYINDYLKVELITELSNIIYNQEEFITHQDIKYLINDVIQFDSNNKLWVDNKNKLFVKNEKINENFF